MHTVEVGIVGASGYSGIELTRVLAGHPRVSVRFLTSDRWVGHAVEEHTSIGGPVGRARYAPVERAIELAAGCAAVFLATPAEASLQLAPSLLAAGARVIDLSGAFRLRDAKAYPRHYGLEHGAPDLLASAVYGLPELFRSEIPSARLVANPGCYPTAAALPLAPLLGAGLLDPGSIVINAASGVTGAGRKASEDFSFAEVHDDFRAYRVLRHQHAPEVSQTLSRFFGAAVPVTFTPHLLPLKRGILCTTFARLRPGKGHAEVRAALEGAFRGEPFVALAPSAEEVSLKRVVGTNRCLIGTSSDAEYPERLIVISAIDNLLKGAAGQAVQNLNLLMGFGEAEGLSGSRGFHP